MYTSKSMLLKFFILPAWLLLLFTSQFANAAEVNVSDYDATVINAPNGLNVRSGPGTNYKIIGSVYNGNIVRVTHTDGAWRRINWSGGKTAWVHGAYLAKKTEEPSCYKDNCWGQNPDTTGCGNDGYALETIYVNLPSSVRGPSQSKTKVEIKYSPKCKAAWARISYPAFHPTGPYSGSIYNSSSFDSVQNLNPQNPSPRYSRDDTKYSINFDVGNGGSRNALWSTMVPISRYVRACADHNPYYLSPQPGILCTNIWRE